jgi:hypothetical protein
MRVAVRRLRAIFKPWAEVLEDRTLLSAFTVTNLNDSGSGSLPLVLSERWVIDGDYRRKLGTLVLEHADTVVWLDCIIRTVTRL